ncbi:MAG: hypothetical protein V4580_05160 [Bacteroidota bacterium]
MKNFAIIALAVFSVALTSCKKDYVCVCTIKSTGEISPGDHFKAGPLTKAAADESCKANNDVYSNDLENCHLE